MHNVLIVGAGSGGTAILEVFLESESFVVQKIADISPDAPGIKKAKALGIETYRDYKSAIDSTIDIIVDTTGSTEVTEDIRRLKPHNVVLIPGTIAYFITQLLDEKEELNLKIEKEETIREILFSSIEDGILVIDTSEMITYANQAAVDILNSPFQEVVGKHVKEVIPTSRLPDVLRSGKKELNKQLRLNDHQEIITSRIPLVDKNQGVLGAFAIFKDITDVVDLAEELTNLKEIQTMLEAIIQSSEAAISVVDANGIGLMINRAYTKITGLEEEDVIGKPATADISEGKSVHYEVLKTRKPVRGAQMKVGPNHRSVLVNVAPIIVDNELKGSVGVIHDLSEIQTLAKELRRARKLIRNLEAKFTFDDIVAISEEMNLTFEQAKLGARTPATILLRGEPGTGKGLIGQAIHNESERRDKPFIRVNCATDNEESLEKELFGDANGPPEQQKGLFEEANQGSLFLDDVGELSLRMQAKLLRVLEEKHIKRVGDTEEIPVDIRIIASTSVNLERAMMSGSFSEALFYKLNRMPIFIPPLRERNSDIKPLSEHFISQLNESYGRQVKGISEQALERLKNYPFPGNARELENIIAQAMIKMHSHENEIKEHHMPRLQKYTIDQLDFITEHEEDEVLTLQQAMDEFERQFILETLAANHYIKSKTAKQLNISIRNLYYKMDKYNIGKRMQDSN